MNDIRTEILDHTCDPESPFYTLVEFTDHKVFLNSPVGFELRGALVQAGYDNVDAISSHEIEWDD